MTEPAAAPLTRVDASGEQVTVTNGALGATIFETPASATDSGRLLHHALANSGLTPTKSLLFTHREPAPTAVQVVLPAPAAGHNAVLLVHDPAGVVTWHNPDQPTQAVQDFPIPGKTSPGTAPLTFTIPHTRFPGAVKATLRGDVETIVHHFSFSHGDTADSQHSVVSLLEYPIAELAAMGAQKWIDKWDQSKHPMVTRWFPPKDGHQVPETLSPTNWAGLNHTKGKTLLFIHGIFSSCTGGFGALIDDTDLWQELHDRYEGRIIGYDHPTVSRSPEQNAADFLEQIPDGIQLDVDIVCHSRGGLVARCLAGQTNGSGLAESPLSVAGAQKVSVGKIVFAATPNGGTEITDPAKWESFINRISSLLTLPDVLIPPPVDEVAGIVASVLELIKVLAVDTSVKLPGLSAMTPNSDLLKALGSYAGTTPTYYAAGSSFAPGPLLTHLFKGVSNLGEVMDEVVFKGVLNDVAVPTYGVGNPADPTQAPVFQAGVARAGDGPPIAGFPVGEGRFLLMQGKPQYWHCGYFDDVNVRNILAEWLNAEA